MADINNFRQLDFQESGEPADNDRVLIVEIDSDKVVGAKNYALAKLKGYISADALAYLEECRLINTSVSEKEERVSNIASQSAELLEATVGETIDTIEQTVISTESGGINEFSVIQKNGTKHILQVRNGKQGDQGVPGGPGPAVPLVQTTGQSTTEAMSQKAVSDSLDSLKSDLDNKTRINYLKPTLSTTTINGVTCTNNGDGTYTVNGTSTTETTFHLSNLLSLKLKANTQYRLCGCPKNSTGIYNIHFGQEVNGEWSYNIDYLGNGTYFIINENATTFTLGMTITSGVTVNNVLFKPMITDDLLANYDDFISWEDSNTKNNQILSYEEIQASTNLSGKVASANALKIVDLNHKLYETVRNTSSDTYITLPYTNPNERQTYFMFGDGNGVPWMGVGFINNINNYAKLFKIDHNNNFKLIDGSINVTNHTVTFNTETTWDIISVISAMPLN